jgi:hypothetical protein
MDKQQRIIFRNKIKVKNKERKKTLDSSMSICKFCGFIGKPIKNQQGSWWSPVYRLIAGIFFIIMFPLTITIDWLLKILGLSQERTLLGKNISKFTMSIPFYLQQCKNCNSPNSMKKLGTQDGRFIYDKFAKDRFIKIND